MKKKLLSLVLAGAMVASTSVSAFADTPNTQNIQVHPGDGNESEIQMKGDIESNTGEILPSTVTVTVPTSANFTVKKDGSIQSGNITITNKGNSKVSVIASKFIDTTGDKHIKLVKTENEVNSREKVFLKLTGGDKHIILTSESNGKETGGSNEREAGKMYDVANDTTAIQASDNFVIKDINPYGKLDLTLEGKGFEIEDSQANGAISDNFKLVLKIKQVSKQASEVSK